LRGFVKFVVVVALVMSAVIVVLIVLNGRDPYGGPIEPSAPH
jgi:hypothetical protein